MKEEKDNKLFLLGIVSVGIAVITTFVSLVLYHNSGDIYLDRSRPGFLPDEEEIQSTVQDEAFKFSDNGPVDKESLKEYAENYEKLLEKLEKIEDPFEESTLSDDSLGISENADKD